MSSKSRLNIMFIAPCFGYGGLEQVILSLVKKIDRKKFNPSFCTLLDPDPEMFGQLKEHDLECYVLDKGRGINASIPFKLARILVREEIDLVNAHDIGATLYAAPAALLARVRTLVHTDHSQILTKRRYMPLYRLIFKSSVTHSITVSRDLERYLLANFGLKQDRVTTIPNAIDVARFSAIRDISYLYDELGILDHEVVIGSIGRLTKQKGMGFLLRAFKKVSSRHPHARLVIVGDGDLRSNLGFLARRLGILDKVVFTGIRRDVPELLQLFDVFVLPSLWEGQPITIMEALAAGRPIIAADVGGNAEILDGGAYGYIVPPGDPDALAESIIMFLADRPYAEQLARKGKIHAEEHLSNEVMVGRYEEVFSSVLS